MGGGSSKDKGKREREERERREREERERREREERERQEREERERQERERQQREREEAERQRERDRLAAIEAERQRLERERLAREEAERQRLAKEKADREGNVDWLTAQIEKLRTQITGENNIIVREQTNIGNTDVLIQKGEFDLKKLRLLIEQENKKGSAYDQGDFELQEVSKQVLECNNRIGKHKSDYDESINIIQTSTNNLKNLSQKYDALFKDNSTETKLLSNKTKIEELNVSIGNLNKNIKDLSDVIDNDKLNVTKLNETIIQLNDTISNLNLIDYSNKVFNNEKILELTEKVDTSLNSFFSYLKTKNVNPELTYGKIKYREIEHQKLNNFSKLLDVLFYCFYFVFILIMICTGNIKREHFLIYIFIGLIPIFFPIVIKITRKIFNGVDINLLNGDKNAFIENDTEYVNAFNI
jgi:hypothetical protein